MLVLAVPVPGHSHTVSTVPVFIHQGMYFEELKRKQRGRLDFFTYTLQYIEIISYHIPAC